jgi:ligand-binding sensor domain-containing protein
VDQYLVDQWGISQGIPSDSINSIVQTPDGYLWIATEKGLVRFDGMKFSKESRFPGTVIPDTLFVDRQGTLWIGGSGVLMSYRSETRRFKTFTTAHGITPDRIRCIKDDIKGNLWIGFWASYVNRFSNGEFAAFNASHGLEGKKINAIVETGNGNLLFGTRENGVFIYKDGKFFQYPIPGLDNVYIIFMYEDRKGELWIGTNHGLFRVSDKGTRRYTTGDGLSHDHISRIIEDNDRNLWIGTINGLNRLKKKQDGTIYFESTLKSFLIFQLFEDKEKSLWIGTFNSGIKRLKDRIFMSYAPLETREAYRREVFQSLFGDRNGDTWIGTLSGKLFRCRGSDLIEFVEPPELSGTAIASIAQDREGNLWLGTNGKGVFLKKNSTFAQFTTRDGLGDNLVTSIYKDSKGNLWCSTFDGVSVIRFPDGDNRFIETLNSRNGLSGRVAHNVYEDKTQNMWIAADNGITVLRDGKIGKKNIEYYFKGNCVTCIYEDLSVNDSSDPGARVYWAATRGAGLKRLKLLKGAAVTSYTTDHGMTTNFIFRFFEDTGENFWLMSDSGILRVSKKELNQLADGSVDTINCRSFGISDGLKSLEFANRFSRNSALKTRNGEFWFITKKGISIVNPARIKINKFPPPVVIEEVFFNRQPVPFHKDTQTGAYSCKGITDFRFRFTAPTFLSPEKIKFRYRLDGYDREWIFLAPGKERAVRYENLEPGTYTFRVIACNAEGVWNPTGDSMTFTLKPLFHQTFLFRAAVFLLLIVLAAAVFYIVRKRHF